MNALRSGLYAESVVIRGLESEDDYLAFARQVVADLDVSGSLEMALAERLVSALWRSRRARRWEAKQLSLKADEIVRKRLKAETLLAEMPAIADERDALRLVLVAMTTRQSVDRRIVDLAVAGLLRIAKARDDETGYAFRDFREDLEWFSGTNECCEPKTLRKIADRALCYFVDVEDVTDRRSLFAYTLDLLNEIVPSFESDAREMLASVQQDEPGALMLSAHLAETLARAEGRLSKQVANALADLQAARALRFAQPRKQPQTFDALA